MEKIKMVITNYLGVEKTTEFDSNQVKEIEKMKDYKKRLKAMANRYSNEGWVNVIIDGQKFYGVQWSEV